MAHAHYFWSYDPFTFLRRLGAKHYARNRTYPKADGWIVYSKLLSNALYKHYSYPATMPADQPRTIRVTYDLARDGAPLKKLTNRLKLLNRRYQESMRDWKTKRPATPNVRRRRQGELQRFLERHRELISAFRYPSDDRLTEGNISFNLQVASTPKDQAVCIDFLKALVDAYAPGGMVRGHRMVDKPVQQRNGWIKRFARAHKKKGWSAPDIVRWLQRELREGTWNQRLKLRYNLSVQTVSKVAGFKLPQAYSTSAP